MDEQSQIQIPPSFLALYSRNGRPAETRAVIEERYDLCEDLAAQTSDWCATLQFKDDLSESDVLRRCGAALRDADRTTPAETEWVVTRIAELLGWRRPDPSAGDHR